MRIETFKAIDYFVEDPLEGITAPYEFAEQLENRGIGFSVFDKDGCIGCGGLLYWTDNQAEAWIRIARRALKNKRKGIEAIMEGMSAFTNVYKGHIFCWVNVDWHKAQRMVRWLGFEEKTELRELHGITYKLWEIYDGNSVNDSRVSCVRSGTDTAG